MEFRKLFFAVAAALFIVMTGTLTFANYSAAPLRVARFDSPDETATAYFVERMVDGLPVASPDAYIAAAQNRIHPRSVNIRTSALIPGGYLGFPALLAAAGIWFGFGATFLITPLVAVGGVVALTYIARRFFDAQTAWLTGILGFMSPVLLYQASYPFLPNVAFASLALSGTALLLTARFRFWGGMLVGLSLFVRPNEIIWLLPLAAALSWRNPVRPALGLLLGFAPTFLGNAIVFGHPLATGYHRFVGSAGSAAAPLIYSGSLLFPFGFDSVRVAKTILRAVLLLWWFFLPAAAGLILIWKQNRRYAVAALALAAWFGAVYGSYRGDALISELDSIGRAEFRYWLPVFFVFVPVVSYAIARLPRAGAAIASVVFVALSVYQVFFAHPDSLLPVARRIRHYHELSSFVQDHTSPDAVIITARTDKIIFPERRVAEVVSDIGSDRELLDLIPASPFTWYVFARLRIEDRSALEQALAARGLHLTPIIHEIFRNRAPDDPELYRIAKV